MELTSFSATTLARFIRTNLVSSVAVVDAHLARLEAANPKLNAVVQLQAEAARRQARDIRVSCRRIRHQSPWE